MRPASTFFNIQLSNSRAAAGSRGAQGMRLAGEPVLWPAYTDAGCL